MNLYLCFGDEKILVGNMFSGPIRNLFAEEYRYIGWSDNRQCYFIECAQTELISTSRFLKEIARLIQLTDEQRDIIEEFPCANMGTVSVEIRQ